MRVILFLALAFTAPALVCAQEKKPVGTGLCSRYNALQTVNQQIDFTRTFDDQVKRITVLLQVADMIWPYREDNSRSAFTEALELAKKNFKEKGDKPLLDGHLIWEVPDQRFAVITSIARRDPGWARKLMDQMLREEAETGENASKDEEQVTRTGEKLLGLALSLLSSDQNAALQFARSSLRYPPTYMLPMFLYRLAETNRPPADSLYQEALRAYSGASTERFLYLAVYAFGNGSDVGQPPMMAAYLVPKGFLPSQILERLFVQALLRRAQSALENAGQLSTRGRLSDNQQIYLACSGLETKVEQYLPDLIAPLRQAKGSLFALLNLADQENVTRRDSRERDPDAYSFDNLVAAAERQKDPSLRDGRLAMAIISSAHSNRPSDQPFEKIVATIEKIDNQDLRDKLLNWAYFEQAQKYTEKNELDEARRYASKVIELDQRAYLYLKIAEASLKSTTGDTQARELLEDVISVAGKAPDTIVKARALLGIAYLYTKVEPTRSLAVLSDAVKTINHIEAPDFSSDDAGRRIEGKGFGAYAMMKTPGFDPQNGFREIAKYDLEGTMYLAGTFADKSLRTLTTLALIEDCLKSEPTPPAKARAPKKP